MIYFTAHTFKCVCHCRRVMFRVLGMYNFATSSSAEKLADQPAKSPFYNVEFLHVRMNKFKFYFINISSPLCLDMRPPASYRSLLESLRASFQISRKREKTHICWLLIYKCIKMTFVLTVDSNKSLKKGKILNMHNFRSYIHIVLIKIFIDINITGLWHLFFKKPKFEKK